MQQTPETRSRKRQSSELTHNSSRQELRPRKARKTRHGGNSATGSFLLDHERTEESLKSPHVKNLTCQRLPNEVLFHIINYLVPQKPVANSTEINTGFCGLTLLSLLQTSTSIRDEVLRQSFDRPLHFIFRSRLKCCCQGVRGSTGDLDNYSRSAVRQLLTHWKEMVVIFAPDLPKSRCHACAPIRATRSNTQNEKLSPAEKASHFRHAVERVLRRATTLANMMECVAHTEHNAHQPRVQFVFQSKFTPLWDVDMIYRFLSPWRWVQPQEGKMHPIRFPRRIRIRLDENGEKAFSFKVSSEGQPVQVFLQARLEEDLKTWWDAFSREQPKARFKRLILDPEDEQVWPMGLGGLTINDMEIS